MLLTKFLLKLASSRRATAHRRISARWGVSENAFFTHFHYYIDLRHFQNARHRLLAVFRRDRISRTDSY